MHDDTINAVDRAVGLAELLVSAKLGGAGGFEEVVSSLLLWREWEASSMLARGLLLSRSPLHCISFPFLREGTSTLARVRIVRCCAIVVRTQ